VSGLSRIPAAARHVGPQYVSLSSSYGTRPTYGAGGLTTDHSVRGNSECFGAGRTLARLKPDATLSTKCPTRNKLRRR